MLDKKTAERVLAAALANGGDFAEIFWEDRYNNALNMRNDTVESVQSGRTHGAGVRVLDGTRSVYAYTNDTGERGLLDCAGKAAAAVNAKRVIDAVTLAETTVENRHPILYSPAQTTHAQRLEVMRAAAAAAREAGPEVCLAIARYIDGDQHVCIANSEGLYIADRRVYTRLTISAVASSGTENQTGFEGPGAMRGIELFRDFVDPAAAGREAGERAVRMLHAPVCPPGVMPVVMAGGFGGVVFHEACGHSLEATSVGTGQSEFCGKIGQKIAADCVTAVDDGTIPNAWGSENIDDEGLPTTRLVLIEKGVLRNYMIDRLGSRRMGSAPTGSGRRQGYAFAATSRMRNTYIAAGTDDEDEMIATAGEGLYAAKMGGGSVNPVTGEFNFAVDEGFLIKNGKIDTPVRGASLIGRGSEVLLKIDRVGRTVTCGQGMCGSLSGSVPTNVGQPSIRISSLTVGGR